MFAEMFPPETPIGTILTKEHIEALTLEQLHDFHNQTFVEDNIRIFVTGNIDEVSGMRYEVCGSKVQEVDNLGSAAVVPQSKCQENSYGLTVLRSYGLSSPRTIIENREGAFQSSFILCKKNIGYTHEDRRNFEILSVLYGGYFGSRLMQNLREDNGYTYSVFCSSLFYENESVFYIEADVEVGKTKTAIQECFNEMKLLQKRLVTEKELALVKSYMLGELLREVENSVSYQKKYAFWSGFNLDEKEMQFMMDAIQKITPRTIQALAKKYLVSEMFTIIVVGKMK